MNQAGKTISELQQLPQAIAPPRDLWPSIANAIAAQAAVPPARHGHTRGLPWAASLAASVAMVMLGVLIGRGMQSTTTPAGAGSAAAPIYVEAALRADPRFERTRIELRTQVAQQLAAMAPTERDQVAASLAALRRSVAEIEAAIGREPANALLQELLVSTYQDEMRALAMVAGSRQET